MNNGGDAAEQVVRLSLEGFEVAARLSGSAAKNIALLLVSVLKQEQKTKGTILTFSISRRRCNSFLSAISSASLSSNGSTKSKNASLWNCSNKSSS